MAQNVKPVRVGETGSGGEGQLLECSVRELHGCGIL